MNVYLDASSFTAIVVRDAGWESLASWLEGHAGVCHISDFGWGEFVSAVSIRVRRKMMSEADARTTITAARQFTGEWRRIATTTAEVDAAVGLVERFELGLRMPDALHIALAQRHFLVLLTTDDRQYRAATANRCPVVNPLEGSSPT